MHLRRSECLQRKTDIIYLWKISPGRLLAKKDSGQIGWSVGLFFLVFLLVIIFMGIQVEQYQNISLYLEDALAASNLASAIIDVEQYGISHDILLTDPNSSYELCRSAIKANLNLNQNWEHENSYFIDGKVTLENYTIYNVVGDKVTIYRVNGDHSVSSSEGILGQVYAPCGTLVEGTGIYSEIAFPTRGIFGIRIIAHKGKLVDIQRGEK